MLNPRRVSSSHAPTTLHQGHPKTSDCGNQIGCSPRVEEAEQSHLCCRSRSLASIGHVTPPSTDTEETLRQTSLARAVSVCPRDRSRFCHRKLGPLRFVNKILNLNDRHIVLPKASETKKWLHYHQTRYYNPTMSSWARSRDGEWWGSDVGDLGH